MKCRNLFGYLIPILFALPLVAEEKTLLEKWKEAAEEVTEDATVAMLGKDGGNKLFYVPMQISKTLPSKYGYEYKDVYFKSKGGVKLHGWKIKSTVRKPKGVVVFSHGNTGSVHSHFGFCSWLLNAGWHVFLYDYRGYGESEGTVGRRGLIEDVKAAIDFTLQEKDWKGMPVMSFGHSLGASKSIVALAEMKKHARVKGAVAWAGFSSYVEVAKSKIGDLAKKVVTDELAPKDFVAKVSPLPFMVVHGKHDSVVPISHAAELFANAKKPKRLIISQTGSHNNTLRVESQKGQKEILKWFDSLIKQ